VAFVLLTKLLITTDIVNKFIDKLLFLLIFNLLAIVRLLESFFTTDERVVVSLDSGGSLLVVLR
jgi:hypothetical protein